MLYFFINTEPISAGHLEVMNNKLFIPMQCVVHIFNTPPTITMFGCKSRIGLPDGEKYLTIHFEYFNIMHVCQ